MPVKLSDALVLDARIAGKTMGRSISGQVEFWARLGRAIDPILNGAQAMAASRRGLDRSLSDILAEVDTPVGRQRMAEHLDSLPYPHYQPHPDRPGFLIRIEADGRRTIGRFQQRIFMPASDA